MKTNPIFSLKNFRSFGEAGADFELAPITVLTGCNSAGKSSLVKALMLLSSQPEELETSSSSYDIERCMPAVDLNINTKRLMLGQFDKVLNENAENKKLYFSYKIWSDYLQEEVVVKRQFIPNRGDILNNGELAIFTIEKSDGSLIYEYDGLNEHEVCGYFNVIEENYKRFISAIDYLRAKEYYSLVEGKCKQHELEKASQWIKSANEVLVKYNIQIECYKQATMKKWLDKYEDVLYKKRVDEILDSCLSEGKKEDRRKGSYMSLLVNEVVRPWFIKDVEYINSSSAIINRLYSSEDDNKISSSLRKWNERIKFFNNPSNDCLHDMKSNKPGAFLDKWINKFNIGKSIVIEGTPEGLGVLLYLERGDNDRRLLADEGYGITQLASLLLQINNNIEIFVEPDKDDKYSPKLICVEEPEVHLHPKFQSLLAEMFVEAYQKYNIHFIIETHSEYLIRKLQVMVADKADSLKSDDVSLNYVEKDGNEVSTNRKIEILEDGRLSEPFGTGFFDESKTLVMEMLKF